MNQSFMGSLLDKQRILFVNPYGIGDVLFTTPAIKIVKQFFPQTYIAYLCNERTKSILESNLLIDKVFVFEKDWLRELWKANKRKCVGQFSELLIEIKKERFEVALDYSLSRQYGFFLATLGIPVRIGYDYRGRGLFLNQKVVIKEAIHQPMSVFYTRLLEKLGIELDNKKIPSMEWLLPSSVTDWAIEFLDKLKLKNGERMIAIHPGGGMSWGGNARFKRWPPVSFARLVKLLRGYYSVRVLIFGDGSDTPTIHSLMQEVKDGGVIDLSGKVDLSQMAALFGKAWFVVCNDGGPLHVAVSQGVRTVSFFGPVDEVVYGPFRPEGHLVLTHSVECRPCYRNFKFPPCPFEHRCLRELSAENAFHKIREWMDHG